MTHPKPFLIRAPLPGPQRPSVRPWAVKQGQRWRYAKDLVIQVTVESTFCNAEWCLSGIGVVRCLGRGRIVVTA